MKRPRIEDFDPNALAGSAARTGQAHGLRASLHDPAGYGQDRPEISRRYLGEVTASNRRLAAAWVSGCEAVWAFGFALQDAALTAGFDITRIAAAQSTAWRRLLPPRGGIPSGNST